MPKYEEQYMNILRNIYSNGYEEKNQRTRVKTRRVPHAVIEIDLEEEFPILKTKQVFWKTSAKEILWIMQKHSNNINDLDAHIWDEWADDSGSIGKAYGYQVSKHVHVNGIEYRSQVGYVLSLLSEDPSNRRALIDLWNVDDLGGMNLVPCCFASHWTIIDGRLHCMLFQRSADFLVGVPFNTTQYAILTHLFARHLGVKPGILTHCMSDVHMYMYESHIEGAKTMLERWNTLKSIEEKSVTVGDQDGTDELFSDLVEAKPNLRIDSESTDFFEVNINDIHLDNYIHMGNIKFDVAV